MTTHIRTSVITGGASGIGAALAELLRSKGERVITVARNPKADISADLSTSEGVAKMVAEVEKLTDVVDAVYANAGSALEEPLTIDLNYFGTVATLNGLKPFLEKSTSPRAVVTSSMAAIAAVDLELVDALLANDRDKALNVIKTYDEAHTIYGSSKQALSRWIRRNAATAEWAGKGIALNAIAPGIIRTPMVFDLIDTPEKEAAMEQAVPMPLNGFAEPAVVAELLAYLGSAANSHLCGQIIYVDGGSDVVIRGDSVF